MSKIWFLFYNDITSGPFTSEEIQFRISSAEVSSSSFIWAKGQRRWLTPFEWQKELPEFLKKQSENVSEGPIWYVKYEDQNFGPVTMTELVKFLRTLDTHNLEEASIWAIGIENWGTVYEFPQVADRMGVTRRINQRVPLQTSILISKNGMEQIAQTVSISVGGCGIKNAVNLKTGDMIKVTLKGNYFESPVYSQAEVRYTRDEEIGLRFHNISLESRARILDYIKKFNVSENSQKPEAA